MTTTRTEGKPKDRCLPTWPLRSCPYAVWVDDLGQRDHKEVETGFPRCRVCPGRQQENTGCRAIRKHRKGEPGWKQPPRLQDPRKRFLSCAPGVPFPGSRGPLLFIYTALHPTFQGQ